MSSPAYCILAARYADPDHASIVCRTVEAGEVAASQRDRPELWKRIHDMVQVTPYQAPTEVVQAGTRPPVSGRTELPPANEGAGERTGERAGEASEPIPVVEDAPLSEEEVRKEARGRLMAAARNAGTCTVDDLMRYDLALQAHNQNMRAMELLQDEAQARGLKVNALADEIVSAREHSERLMMRRHAVLARLLAEVDRSAGSDLPELVRAGLAEIGAVA